MRNLLPFKVRFKICFSFWVFDNFAGSELIVPSFIARLWAVSALNWLDKRLDTFQNKEIWIKQEMHKFYYEIPFLVFLEIVILCIFLDHNKVMNYLPDSIFCWLYLVANRLSGNKQNLTLTGLARTPSVCFLALCRLCSPHLLFWTGCFLTCYLERFKTYYAKFWKLLI